jgi:cell division septal protein FtsQ
VSALSRTGAVVVSAQRRFRAHRRAGSRRWLTRALVAAGVLAAVVTTGFILANSSLFAVHFVTVEGTSRLAPAEVLKAAAVREGTSLVRVDPGAVARRVERLAPVASAQVTRNWPHGLVIRVVERRPAGVVVSAGHAELLDATGVAFAMVPTAPHGLVTVDVPAPVPGPGEAAARTAMRVLAQLPKGVRGHVASVNARSVEAVSVRLADGSTVVWGSASNGATKAAVLRTLMRRQAQVYDVSTPSVAVTRG